MEILCPIHQFEIRYSNILNFPVVIRDTIAPFVKFANRISIDNENSHSERITLYFDDQNFLIIVSWDRILIKIENKEFNSLTLNNSIIEEPFFNLYSKISELNGFGETRNFLFYSIFINPINEKLDKIIANFTEKYLNKNSLSIFAPYNDIGLSFEKHSDSSQTYFNVGPYTGNNDFKKRNIEIKNSEILESVDCVGEIFEYKYFEITKTITFKKYKEIFSSQTNFINSLWKH